MHSVSISPVTHTVGTYKTHVRKSIDSTAGYNIMLANVTKHIVSEPVQAGKKVVHIYV
jgi:hypothetical protein